MMIARMTKDACPGGCSRKGVRLSKRLKRWKRCCCSWCWGEAKEM